MFKAYTIDTAPEASAELLRDVEKKMGFIPNLYAHLAESPTATKAYMQLSALLAESSLSARELQITLLTVSVENRCHFCVAAHTAGGVKAGVARETLDAIRAGNTPGDGDEAALVRFVRQVIRERGWVSPEEVQRFLDAGFSKSQVLDIITAAALKTLSNYSNHIAQPALNEELAKFAWEADEPRAKAG